MGADKASKKDKKDKKEKKNKKEENGTPAAAPAAAPVAEPVQGKAKKEKKEKKEKKQKKEKRPASEVSAETPATETAQAPASPAKKQKTEQGAVAAPAFSNSNSGNEDDRKIFIGGCPDSITDEAVKEVFDGVESIRWVQKDGQFRGFGFVTFDSEEKAQAAAGRGEVDICGRTCRVNMAGQKPTGGNRDGGNAGGGGGGNARADDSRRVFIGRCPMNIEDGDLSGFEGFESVRWVTDRTSGAFKGVGFITFVDEASAQKLANQGQVDIKGQSCVVRMANAPQGDAGGARGGAGGRAGGAGAGGRDDSKTVFIGGCPDEIDDSDVNGAFPGVVNVRWVKDRETGQFKGAGFVEFDSEDNAKSAASQGSVEIKGRSCRVSMAGDKPAGGRGGGGDRGRGGRGRGRGRGPPKTSLENLGQGTKVTFDD